jgi:hypothetical protein
MKKEGPAETSALFFPTHPERHHETVLILARKHSCFLRPWTLAPRRYLMNRHLSPARTS